MKYIITSLACLFALTADCQNKLAGNLKNEAAANVSGHYQEYRSAALDIWRYAEVGYKEVKSSALLQETLRKNGFSVQAGVAGIPTAFVATYGSGKPEISILAEFDALPGLSQQAVAERNPVAGQDAGHGCGHHLFGTASVAAGVAISNLMAAGKLKGTVKVFGCPAEEGGSGKVYLVREGLFQNSDAVLHWHPSNDNLVTMTSALANKSAKFRFYGVSAHAAAAPDKGRSALDGVEAMNMMVNLMREHIPQETRIHYVITSGGKAPNVVPDYAEVYYYVRHPKREVVAEIFDRIAKAAEGAALGTGTRTDFEVIGGTHDLLLNRTLAEVLQQKLSRTGGVTYTTAELEFAEKIQGTLGFPVPPPANARLVKPLQANMDAGGGSTDVGDVSYVVPTVGLRTATWAPGVPAHSWQAVACGGTEPAIKAMINAANVLASTAIDLYLDPAKLAKAKTEFEQAKGSYQYKALLGTRKPALNYRD
jgi:aminobenzoyl-glutamate utilization protein B